MPSLISVLDRDPTHCNNKGGQDSLWPYCNQLPDRSGRDGKGIASTCEMSPTPLRGPSRLALSPGLGYNAGMATEIAPPTSDAPPVAIPLHQRIAHFYGNPYEFLVWLLAHPADTLSAGMRAVGMDENTLYGWKRELQGFTATLEAVRSYRGDLRAEAAQAVFNKAIIPISEAMVSRAKGEGRDAQRAAERILETVGVLPKAGGELPAPAIQVVTHTYVLVQPAPGQGVVVESTAKELHEEQ